MPVDILTKRAYNAKYRSTHRKELREKSREYRALHLKERAEYLKKYYITHRDKLREYRAKWFKLHNKKCREKLNFNLRRYRARKRTSGGHHKLEDWKEMKKNYNFTCPSCGRKEPEIKLEEDHIIPIICGGKDDIDNLQPLCRSCNSSKSRKTIKYTPKISCNC